MKHKILVGVLAVGLAFSLYVNYRQGKVIKAQRQVLRELIVNYIIPCMNELKSLHASN